MNKGQNAGTPLQRKVSSLDLTMTTYIFLCQKRPHLGRTVKRWRWYEISGNSTLRAVDEKVFLLGLNRSNYRGLNYRLVSGTLGLCLTGVKKESKVKCNTYHYVNVGSMMVGLFRKIGLTAEYGSHHVAEPS